MAALRQPQALKRSRGPSDTLLLGLGITLIISGLGATATGSLDVLKVPTPASVASQIVLTTVGFALVMLAVADRLRVLVHAGQQYRREGRAIADALTRQIQEEEARFRAAIASAVTTDQLSADDIRREVDRAVNEILLKIAPQGRTTDALTSVVEDYHRDGLQQSKFWFFGSLVAAAIGIVWLLGTAVTAPDQLGVGTVIKGLPGLVFEGIAALFFQQAAAVRERATELLDRARSDAARRHAVSIVDSIDNEQLRDETKARVALQMLDAERRISEQRLPQARRRAKATISNADPA